MTFAISGRERPQSILASELGHPAASLEGDLFCPTRTTSQFIIGNPKLGRPQSCYLGFRGDVEELFNSPVVDLDVTQGRWKILLSLT